MLKRFIQHADGIAAEMIRTGGVFQKDYDPTDILAGVQCPYLYIDCGQPDVDLGLLRELCPQVVIGKTVGAGHKALQDVPDQTNAMLKRFIQHADGIAAEMIRTGGVFQYNFPSG